MAWKRFVACSDFHGHHHDRKAVDVLQRFTDDFQPDRRWFLGDLFDLSALRSDATAEDKAEGVTNDLSAGLKFLRDWQPHVVLMGNHDERLWVGAKSINGLVSDCCHAAINHLDGVCRKIGATVVPYGAKDVHQEGPFTLTHGIAHNMHAAKTHAEAYPGATLFGHTHCVDYYRMASLDRREAWNIGCLCNTYPEYARRRRNTLRWEHGFVYGAYCDETNDYHVEQARPDSSGTWRMLTAYREYLP